jgi:hypothetical protein
MFCLDAQSHKIYPRLLFHIPGMEAVLDNLLPVLPPLIAIIQHIDVASGLEAEPRLPHRPPHLHLPSLCHRSSRSLPPRDIFAHLMHNMKPLQHTQISKDRL